MKLDNKYRKTLIAKIHLAKAQLVLSDDMYREMLFNLTGHESCIELNTAQLSKVIDHLKGVGFKPLLKKAGGEHKPAIPYNLEPLRNKIGALLCELGKAWAYADAIAYRMYSLPSLSYANALQLKGIITALNRSLQRQKRKEESLCLI